MSRLSIEGIGDTDDPIVWQCGKWLPDGRFRMHYMTESVERELFAVFGGEWVQRHRADVEQDLAAWGVN